MIVRSLRALVVSSEPRLVRAIREVLGDVECAVFGVWDEGCAALFEGGFDLALVDAENLRRESVVALAPVNTALRDTVSVVLARRIEPWVRELEVALPSVSQVVDMSLGKAAFESSLRGLVQRIVSSRGDIGAEARRRLERQAKDRSQEQERQRTKAWRATEEPLKLVAELRQLRERVRSVSSYEVLEVSAGCGRERVQERFYALVKEHHPDAYGGNVSSEVKSLAQDIFIRVKEAYQEVLRQEQRTQTPAARSSSVPGGVIKEAVYSSSNAESSGARTGSGAGQSEEARQDVRARMERLSGFRRRQEVQARRVSRSGAETLEGLSEASQGLSEASQGLSEASQVEVDPEQLRREKLLALQRKASLVDHPNLTNPAKEAFNQGYLAYKAEQFGEAFRQMKIAYELMPDHGMYLTYYGYLLFRQHPDRHEEAEEILRQALNSGNRQALPDAFLFMGHLLKARKELDKAYKHYERALRLNPGCVEAERELRLAKIRKDRTSSEPGAFIKNLFKK